jgi:hypothetical protein
LNQAIHRVFLDRIHGYRLLDESECGGFISKTHVGQREIANKNPILRLLPEERFQFAARLFPTFLGGSVVTGNFLRPA